MSELSKQAKTLAEIAQTCFALSVVCKNCIAECEFEDNTKTFRGKWIPLEVAEKAIQQKDIDLGEADGRFLALHFDYTELKGKVEAYDLFIKKLNQKLQNFPTRPSHHWIINNLDKAEDIELAFRRIEESVGELLNLLNAKEFVGVFQLSSEGKKK